MKTIHARLGLGISILALAGLASSLALADGAPAGAAARHECAGEHGGKQSAADRAQHAAERFKKADKNGDGFLTQEEVGEKRWAHIQIADANKDGKISQAELQQAHENGQLGHNKRDRS